MISVETMLILLLFASGIHDDPAAGPGDPNCLGQRSLELEKVPKQASSPASEKVSTVQAGQAVPEVLV